jgi:Zn-dependent protease
MDFLRESLALFVTFFGAVVTALIVGIAFHEFSHAFVANALGDRTARMLGRLTLNPVAHLDPAGTTLMMIAGFGWGKPVPVNPYRLRNGPETGRAMVAAAGPLSNLLVAAVAAALVHLLSLSWISPFILASDLRVLAAFVSTWGVSEYLGLYLSSIILLNIVLAVFNLIPLAPLDGFAVAIGLLPRDLGRAVARLEPYGMAILMLLLILPFVTGGSISILHEIMRPAINGLTELLIGGQSRAIG